MGNWQLDPYHTQVEFSAKHLGMMTVRGYFDEVSTTADIDPEHPETASVEATISTASIRTNNGMRDNDLRLSNFLEVDRYPTITFRSTGVEPAGPDQLHADRGPDHQGHHPPGVPGGDRSTGSSTTPG